MDNIILIDFKEFDGPLYSTRVRGERSRKKANLEELDEASSFVELRVPNDLLTITSSFFLGMFDKSIIKYGSKEEFKKHYKFLNIPNTLSLQMDDWIDRVLKRES